MPWLSPGAACGAMGPLQKFQPDGIATRLGLLGNRTQERLNPQGINVNWQLSSIILGSFCK